MVWDKATDTFVYRFDTFLSYSKSTALTKRGLLQLLARVYDPLGLISPIMVALRCTFQQVCKLGIGWDDDVPAEQRLNIRKWLKSLAQLNSYCVSSILPRIR